MKLKSFWYNNSLFSSNQNVNILEIKPGRYYTVDIEAEPKKLKATSEFGVTSNAVAALNGTFFDMKNGGSMDYIRVNGSLVNPNRLQANNTRALHQKAAIVIDYEGVNIVAWDSTMDWEERLSGEDVMVSGPLLVDKGNITKLDSSTVYMTRHPRSALAIKDGKILLITIDGRSEEAAGMSLHELAHFMKWLKADKAINLDGGGSTTLWIQQGERGHVVNHPSDSSHTVNQYNPINPKYPGRPVANVIIVKKKRIK